jgi:hypothetical protein
MINTTYRILTHSVTIYGITQPVTKPWTITAVWFCSGEPCCIEVNGKGWPVEGGSIPIPIDEWNNIKKELL